MGARRGWGQRVGSSLVCNVRTSDNHINEALRVYLVLINFLITFVTTLDSVQKPKSPVPIPFSLARYIDDPSFQHEDFNGSSAGTLRARVSGSRDRFFGGMDMSCSHVVLWVA